MGPVSQSREKREGPRALNKRPSRRPVKKGAEMSYAMYQIRKLQKAKAKVPADLEYVAALEEITQGWDPDCFAKTAKLGLSNYDTEHLKNIIAAKKFSTPIDKLAARIVEYCNESVVAEMETCSTIQKEIEAANSQMQKLLSILLSIKVVGNISARQNQAVIEYMLELISDAKKVLANLENTIKELVKDE
jgi:hypothetical protein